ncbi:MAG: 50S ribosomal protein L23 [Clostridia bacterium]|nr:50S ribosomal protein L23 [Clostridia bacterium]
MTAHDIILEPVLTEKSYAGIANKVYTFVVNKNANKIEIAKAVEELFDVEVARVNTLNCKGKIRTRNTKSGVKKGSTGDYKKAVVFLKDSSKAIEFFESLS